MRRTRKGTHERGQVLVLFAGGMIGLLAIAALAIDLSSVYSAKQTEKAAADAAALAGGQQLQVKGSRALGDQTSARTIALQNLAGRFGVAVPSLLTGKCIPSVNIVDCPLAGTPYLVSISTPAQTPTTSDPKSIQVTVRIDKFQMTFARLFGQSGWNVGEASVAVVDNARSYALMTLRPPATGTTSDVKDITLNGTGTHVTIRNGDVGSNANMYYDGGGGPLYLDPGYKMYYFDPYNPPEWVDPKGKVDPEGNKLLALIQDPQYTIPSETSPTPPDGGFYTDDECVAIATTLLGDPFYGPLVVLDPKTGDPDPDYNVCFKKGKYTATEVVDNGHLVILEPGLYFFDAGLTVKGTLIGGYTAGSQGVALVFPEGNNVFTTGGTAGRVYLNAGAKLATPAGAGATAALDFSGTPVKTNTTPSALMTLMVQPDLNCEGPGRTIVLPIPASCAMPETDRSAIKLAGTSALYLGGVQYAPTDNMTLNSSSSAGYVGQIVAWTVKYSGGTEIFQEGLVVPTNGVLRLDSTCSGAVGDCVHP